MAEKPTRVKVTIQPQMGTFSIAPHWLLERCKNSQAIHLYVALGKWCWGSRGGKGHPKREELMAVMGISRSALARAMAELKDAGGVTVTLRHRPSDGAVIGAEYTLVQVDPAFTQSLTDEKKDRETLNSSNETEDSQTQSLTDEKKANAIVPDLTRLSPENGTAIEEETDSINRQEQGQGATAPDYIAGPDPEAHLDVITRIVHGVIDSYEQLGQNIDDLPDADLAAMVKDDIAAVNRGQNVRSKIQYDSAVVGKAIDSARWQRRHRKAVS